MADKIIITRTYCDDHMQMCNQAHNTATGRTICVDYNDYTRRLLSSGYYYAGHRAGQYTYTRRASRPLALPDDWQLALQLADAHDAPIDQYQDW